MNSVSKLLNKMQSISAHQPNLLDTWLSNVTCKLTEFFFVSVAKQYVGEGHLSTIFTTTEGIGLSGLSARTKGGVASCAEMRVILKHRPQAGPAPRLEADLPL